MKKKISLLNVRESWAQTPLRLASMTYSYIKVSGALSKSPQPFSLSFNSQELSLLLKLRHRSLQSDLFSWTFILHRNS